MRRPNSAHPRLSLVALAVGLLLASGAQATTLTLGLDTEFSGPGAGITPPAGPTPWVSVTFDDSFGGANTVRVTMTADNLTGGERGENIRLFLFNFDPNLDPTQLSFMPVDIVAADPITFSTGVNAFMADGDGNFDIEFAFPTGNGPKKRFTAGESIIYDITYVAPITVSSFDFLSEMGGGQGAFQAAAHIQRTNGGPDSAWIGVVPEPGTGALMALGLAALGIVGRRRR